MRSQTVTTNETCNQNCAFCNARRPLERREVAAVDAVLARIAAVVAEGAEEVVLTGGEPTLRRDLAHLVAHARRAGAERVVLETNGALIDDARAAALARAGLERARVHLPLWGAVCDEVTRDPGGFARTLDGMAALARAGVRIEVATPVVRANAARVDELPAAIAASGLPVEGMLLHVPTEGPAGEELLPLAAAAEAIARVAEAGRAVGVVVRMGVAAPLAPCLFAQPARVAHLYALSRGGAERPDHVHVPPCAGCTARPICPGLPRAALVREPDLAGRLRPIVEERTRRRLSRLSTVEEQVTRELVTRDVRRMPTGGTVRENIVRINFHCNQACPFCFVSTHLPPAAEAAVEAAIVEIGALGGVLTLSGGEPTLNPRLADYVALGKRLGASCVELQTNAIRLADEPLSRGLAAAGLDVAFVSLHASTADLSDKITAAPGTFGKTVAGIDALARAGVELRLNFVLCTENQHDFPAYVRMVAARWPAAMVNFSFVAASTDLVPLDARLIPRYADVMPSLAEGVRLARALGLRLSGFESMCGVPLCQVPDDLTPYFDLAEAPDDRGEFVKPEVCRSCALERRCFGLRRGYASLHGASELRPVARPSPEAQG